MKYLIIPLILFPATSFAWTTPKLESICLGDKNAINITLSTEPNYRIEFSDDFDFGTVTTVDFVHAGSHTQYLPLKGIVYARYASDHNAKTSDIVKDCTPPKEEKKTSGRRKKKHGYVRRPSVFANPTPAILPLFDYPVWNLKD